MFSIVHQSIHTLMEITSQMVDMAHTARLHNRIYKAIRKRDPQEARARMLAHLQDAKDLLSRSQEAQAHAKMGDRLAKLAAR
jgi:DNA-binding FadR family transcriptional regulator